MWKLRLTPTPRDSLIVDEESIEGQFGETLGFVWGPSDQGSELVREIAGWRSPPLLPKMAKPAEAGTAIVRHSDNWGIFQFSDTSTRAGIRRRCYRDDNLKLHSDGSNLAAILDKLQKSHPTAYHRIIETIRQIAPGSAISSWNR